MKNIIFICCLIAFSIIGNILVAQAPQKMSYQAVIRDASNNLVVSSNVGIRISILQGSTSGNAVFVETHTPISNSNGLLTIEIGNGTVVSGSFVAIDWANGPYFVQTETDPNGGTNYSITGTSQLLSVPYALYAKNTDSWTDNADTTYTNDKIVINGASPNSYIVGPNVRHAAISYTGIESVPVIIKRETGAFNSSFGASNSVGTAMFGVNQNGEACIGFSADQSSAVFRVLGTSVNNNGSVILKPSNNAPSSPVKGQMYFDNTLNKLRVWDGTTWQNCW